MSRESCSCQDEALTEKVHPSVSSLVDEGQRLRCFRIFRPILLLDPFVADVGLEILMIAATEVGTVDGRGRGMVGSGGPQDMPSRL